MDLVCGNSTVDLRKDATTTGTVVTANEVRLPERVHDVNLEAYLSRQREICRVCRWEMRHIPCEEWTRTREEFEAREAELKKLMDGSGEISHEDSSGKILSMRSGLV